MPVSSRRGKQKLYHHHHCTTWSGKGLCRHLFRPSTWKGGWRREKIVQILQAPSLLHPGRTPVKIDVILTPKTAADGNLSSCDFRPRLRKHRLVKTRLPGKIIMQPPSLSHLAKAFRYRFILASASFCSQHLPVECTMSTYGICCRHPVTRQKSGHQHCQAQRRRPDDQRHHPLENVWVE